MPAAARAALASIDPIRRMRIGGANHTHVLLTGKRDIRRKTAIASDERHPRDTEGERRMKAIVLKPKFHSNGVSR
jgi:hypothetical protein